MTEFKIPELGENIMTGDVVRVLVKAGDTVEKDQPVIELETDKATIEVPSSVSGTVTEVKVKQGDKVKVGQIVLMVGDDGGGAPKEAEAAEEKKEDEGKTAARGAKSDTRAKQRHAATESEAEAEEAKHQSPDAAEAGGMSQAAVPEPAAESDLEPKEEGAPAQARKRRGEVVDISRGARGAQQPAVADAGGSRAAPAPAAPSVRRLARELGVDIHLVAGTGPEGRISTDDVQAYVRNALSGGPGAPGVPAAPSRALPDFSKWGEVERKPMSNVRRKTSEHLGHAWSVIPHVTQHDRADITAIEELRQKYAPQAEKAGGKLTMTAIALKIVAGALQRFPQFNSSIDPGRNEIVYKRAIHVGIAADTPRGLLVPVIRDVDRKGILELSTELAQASDKARSGKLSLDEMSGAGFTITNLGGIGGTSFTPIVNWPEVAILGVSRASYEPRWRPGDQGSAPSAPGGEQGSFEPRLMLPLSLSYDHRVIDGADAARFLRWVCEALEQPFILSL
jgi:pyruvate dehydrogenase E2 component (dihydrolipoamide acetyltransferase)